jgi:hypothetical protein
LPLSKAARMISGPTPAGSPEVIPTFTLSSRLSDLEVSVEFFLEYPPCKEGRFDPAAAGLKSALRAEKNPVFLLREAEFQSGSRRI